MGFSERGRLMKSVIFVMVSSLLLGLAFADDWNPAYKTRVIQTTDGEGDDQQSYKKFLLYTNEFDVKAMVYTSSCLHSIDRGGWNGTSWMEGSVEEYRQAYPNLIKHDPAYPHPDSLLKRIYIGNCNYDDMTSNSAGADAIVQLLLDPDESEIWCRPGAAPIPLPALLKQ
jgi:hypothetical protein